MESGGKAVTKRHRKKWVDALSLVLPVLLFFAVLNCFTTYYIIRIINVKWIS